MFNHTSPPEFYSKKESEMKQYTIGLITGALLTVSAMMFMGLKDTNRDYDYEIDSEGNHFLYDNNNGRIIEILPFTNIASYHYIDGSMELEKYTKPQFAKVRVENIFKSISIIGNPTQEQKDWIEKESDRVEQIGKEQEEKIKILKEKLKEFED